MCTRNDGIFLHAIDEDEAPRVLQLALHDLQIEERAGSARRRCARFVDVVRDELVEQRRRERDVASRAAARRDRRRACRGARPGSR